MRDNEGVDGRSASRLLDLGEAGFGSAEPDVVFDGITGI
jgi:hypothetical protein